MFYITQHLLPQVTIAQDLFAHRIRLGIYLVFTWLVIGFRPVAESSLAQSFLGLAPL